MRRTFAVSLFVLLALLAVTALLMPRIERMLLRRASGERAAWSARIQLDLLWGLAPKTRALAAKKLAQLLPASLSNLPEKNRKTVVGAWEKCRVVLSKAGSVGRSVGPPSPCRELESLLAQGRQRSEAGLRQAERALWWGGLVLALLIALVCGIFTWAAGLRRALVLLVGAGLLLCGTAMQLYRLDATRATREHKIALTRSIARLRLAAIQPINHRSDRLNSEVAQLKRLSGLHRKAGKAVVRAADACARSSRADAERQQQCRDRGCPRPTTRRSDILCPRITVALARLNRAARAPNPRARSVERMARWFQRTGLLALLLFPLLAPLTGRRASG